LAWCLFDGQPGFVDQELTTLDGVTRIEVEGVSAVELDEFLFQSRARR
jgi:hypothetical protein